MKAFWRKVRRWFTYQGDDLRRIPYDMRRYLDWRLCGPDEYNVRINWARVHADADTPRQYGPLRITTRIVKIELT